MKFSAVLAVLTSRVNDQSLEMTGGSRLEATRGKALRNFHDEIMRGFAAPVEKESGIRFRRSRKRFLQPNPPVLYRRVKRHWITNRYW